MLREVCETVAVWVCGCTFGGVYVPCIYLHARWSYHRRFRSVVVSLVCWGLLTPVFGGFDFWDLWILIGGSTEQTWLSKMSLYAWFEWIVMSLKLKIFCHVCMVCILLHHLICLSQMCCLPWLCLLNWQLVFHGKMAGLVRNLIFTRHFSISISTVLIRVTHILYCSTAL